MLLDKLNRSMTIKIGQKHIFLLLCMMYCVFANAQKTTVMDFDYSQFRSYFSEVYYDSSHGLELPRNTFTRNLYITDKPEEKIYAVAVIKNSNGDDLFLIHRTISDLNLEYSSIVVFRNQYPLSSELQEIIIENAPDSDGGIFNQFYEIENTTIRTNIFWSECCSSSGYNTPVAVRAVIGFSIDGKGSPVIQSVDTCVFSSRFFDLDYLPSLIKSKELYPTEKEPFVLNINNWTKPLDSFYAENIRLSFYLDTSNNKPITVLVSKDKSGNIIDTYKIVKSKTSHKEPVSSINDPVFKNYIIIKASGKDIILLSNGKFF